ncbi:MAG: type II toxin-antitoxin system VapC family toxin [Candidatus Competibacteraceae bacterium]
MSEIVLLDTNVISFLMKGDSRSIAYQPHLQGRRLAISFMTVAELFQWAAIHTWGKERTNQLEASLKNYIVLPFDVALCRIWGEIRAKRRAEGRPISPQDAWIVASALQYQLSLVTHNPDDFAAIEGLVIITTLSRPA